MFNSTHNYVSQPDSLCWSSQFYCDVYLTNSKI